VLALFGSARTDRQNASTFATGQETLRLADAAVNLVQGQIRDATIQPSVGWASQPGMIRTFGTSGNATTAYKLYSSDEMRVSNFGPSQINAETTAMSTWNAGAANTSYNALYCDLNSPAAVKRPQPGNESQTEDALVFPIADPAAIGAVEGFSANTSVAGTVLGNGTTRRLPMPVKWIYVLRDGQMTAPTSGDSSMVTFSGTPLPTQDNPIVGRIAFWADDETCKLNINTASEGSFWDPPRASTKSDKRLAIAMPVQGEFQRLPGHPATTSLSVALNNLLPVNDPIFLRSDFADLVGSDLTYYQSLAPYYSLTPRINNQTVSGGDNTSQAGLKRTVSLVDAGRGDSVTTDIWPAVDQILNIPGSPVVSDSDRLYATNHEILYNPNRLINNPTFTPREIAMRDFFLTATGRAPETTIFSTPRISIWPQQTNAAQHRNVKDRLIAVCSTVNGNEYFFQRNANGPGLINGGTPSSDEINSDANLVGNSKIFDYFSNLASVSVPGYNNSFANKLSDAGVNKVRAQIFDFIRSNINEHVTTGMDRTYQFSSYFSSPTARYHAGPVGSVVPARIGSDIGMGKFITCNEFALVFIASSFNPDNSTTSMRAFLVMQHYTATPGSPTASIGFVTEIQGLSGLQVELNNGLGLRSLNFPTGTLRSRSGSNSIPAKRSISAFAFSNPLSYLLTLPDAGNDYRNTQKKTIGNINHDTSYPFASLADVDTTGATQFRFNIFDVNGIYTGLPIRINVRFKPYNSNDTIQNLEFDFPPVTNWMPLPQSVGSGASEGPINLTIPGDNNYLSINNRFAANNGFASTLIRPGDVVLGVRLNPSGPSNGDLRTLSITSNVTSNWFAPHPSYGRVSQAFVSPITPTSAANAMAHRFAHSLRADGFTRSHYPSDSTDTGETNHTRLGQFGWQHIPNTTRVGRMMSPNTATDPLASRTESGTLVPNVSFGANATPVLALGTRGAMLSNGRLGDWSGGYGNMPDGAYFPRPDPGNAGRVLGGYFSWDDRDPLGDAVAFEPSRTVPSSGILGSLLTTSAIGELQPWQTILLNPVPASGPLDFSSHPGFLSPPDHLLSDFFWMPNVEPYPISEPISTAGKVNLNQQILPFSNIERTTSFRGLIRPLMLASIRDETAYTGASYKWGAANRGISENIRQYIDENKTTIFLNSRFESGSFYFTGSEICSIPIVPVDPSINATNSTSIKNQLQNWWSARRITSDTLREQPYTAMLSRVTTKSNTFTVHYRVQALRQPPRAGHNWAEWEEARDQVVGEYRGSTTIERFLDPNAQNIPDYTQVNLSGNYDPIDKFYRWRVLSQKQFAP
jgi:uncharacterized protein (TIGR02600 family)